MNRGKGPHLFHPVQHQTDKVEGIVVEGMGETTIRCCTASLLRLAPDVNDIVNKHHLDFSMRQRHDLLNEYGIINRPATNLNPCKRGGCHEEIIGTSLQKKTRSCVYCGWEGNNPEIADTWPEADFNVLFKLSHSLDECFAPRIRYLAVNPEKARRRK